MEMRSFGTTGRQVASIGKGPVPGGGDDPATAVAAVRKGLGLGMTHVDTAEMYGSGTAEEIVGRAIAERRDEVFLASKVLPQHASRGGTVAACEASLGPRRAPTGWTVTCCTGAASTRWRIRSPPSSSSSMRAESCPGA